MCFFRYFYHKKQNQNLSSISAGNQFFEDIFFSQNSTNRITPTLVAYKSIIHRSFSIPLNEPNLKGKPKRITIISINNGYKKDLTEFLIN